VIATLLESIKYFEIASATMRLSKMLERF